MLRPKQSTDLTGGRRWWVAVSEEIVDQIDHVSRFDHPVAVNVTGAGVGRGRLTSIKIVEQIHDVACLDQSVKIDVAALPEGNPPGDAEGFSTRLPIEHLCSSQSIRYTLPGHVGETSDRENAISGGVSPERITTSQIHAIDLLVKGGSQSLGISITV
jgi:hypothetical protein